jgi:hypothetical protein
LVYNFTSFLIIPDDTKATPLSNTVIPDDTKATPLSNTEKIVRDPIQHLHDSTSFCNPHDFSRFQGNLTETPTVIEGAFLNSDKYTSSFNS